MIDEILRWRMVGLLVLKVHQELWGIKAVYCHYWDLIGESIIGDLII